MIHQSHMQLNENKRTYLQNAEEMNELTAESVALDRDLNPEALEVDDDCKDSNSHNQVHDVGEALMLECLTCTERAALVVEAQVEE